MAIYHFSVKVVKRSEGKSAVATAAWKADQVLYDERYGLTVHPRQTKTIVLNQILLPASVSARFLDRAKLWNAVEVGEARRDSQLARVINVPSRSRSKKPPSFPVHLRHNTSSRNRFQ